MRRSLVHFETDGDMWNGALWAITSSFLFILLGLIPFFQHQPCDYIQTVTECPLFTIPPQFMKTFTSTLNTHPLPPPPTPHPESSKKNPSGAGIRREQSGCKLHECTVYFDFFFFFLREWTQCQPSPKDSSRIWAQLCPAGARWKKTHLALLKMKMRLRFTCKSSKPFTQLANILLRNQNTFLHSIDRLATHLTKQSKNCLWWM